MQNHDYTQGKSSASKDVKETSKAFETERKKFATQMDARLLKDLRDFAKSEGRQIQSVLEEAVEAFLKEKRGYVMRPDVKAAHDEVLRRYDTLFEALAK